MGEFLAPAAAHFTGNHVAVTFCRNHVTLTFDLLTAYGTE